MLAACPPAPGPPTLSIREHQALIHLAGTWHWFHADRDDETAVVEREDWVLDPVTYDPATGTPVVLGRYRRDVSVVALDGTPFLCNEQTAYVQSAVYDVRVAIVDHELAIEEHAYRTAESPCEPRFRRLGAYTAGPPGERALTLHWDDGEQTLERVDGPVAVELPPAVALAGPWHWAVRSRDAAGRARAQDEAWELGTASDGTVAGTYVRTVTTWAEDGSPIPCAGAPSWRFVDRYKLRGYRDGDVLRLEEVAVDPGQHPCLAATPDRHLDTATVELDGAHVLLTWRGNRRQVLHRD